MTPFVDACLAAPLGVTLLACLEAAHRAEFDPFGLPHGCSPDAVAAAVHAVEEMSFGELCAIAVGQAGRLVGPWQSEAAAILPAAYRHAEARAPIAAAIDRRFDVVLHAPLDPSNQQWWTTKARPSWPFDSRCRFHDFERVYGNGEFSWAGLWTVTDPPAEIHDELVGAWEMYPGPVSRWRLPVRAGARIAEIHRPSDWTALAVAHPHVAAPSTHAGWELLGPNQHDPDLRLLDEPGQHAAAIGEVRQVTPDWRSVAMQFDAVHLSWAGFITAEGYVDVDVDRVTMLRYWSSERTSWLADRFAEPEPLDAPHLTGCVADVLGVSALDDPVRRGADLRLINAALGR